MLYPEQATCWLSDDVKWVGELYQYCKLSMSMSIASYQVLRMAPVKCCHDNTVCSLSEYATCIWFVKYSQLAFDELQLKFNNSTYILITVLVGQNLAPPGMVKLRVVGIQEIFTISRKFNLSSCSLWATYLRSIQQQSSTVVDYELTTLLGQHPVMTIWSPSSLAGVTDNHPHHWSL